jgi:hypothetical protein
MLSRLEQCAPYFCTAQNVVVENFTKRSGELIRNWRLRANETPITVF